MNPRTVASYVGAVFLIISFFLLLPLALAIMDGSEMRTFAAYLVTFVMALIFGVTARLFGRGASKTIYRKDACGVVAFSWLALGALGALPFLIEGSLKSPVAAFFEAVSGFTTTGASAISDIDSLSRATHLWRCLMHWLGGMGVVVLFVAIFPQVGIGTKQLFRQEASGPISEGLRPRVRQTASTLWWIYSALTAGSAVLFFICGMSPFDAICHAMSTVSTGGFSTRTDSIAGFSSPAIEWAATGVMFLSSINFALYFGLVRGKFREFFANHEMRFFLGVNLCITVVIFFAILGDRDSIMTAFRHALFQVVSTTSTTGLMSDDYNRYPDLARYLLFLAMFMGGCTGSTAGGLKALRVLLLIKLAFREVRLSLTQNLVVALRVDKKAISNTYIHGILSFTVIYMLTFVLASTLMVSVGLDLTSAMSAVVTCLSGVGPGLDSIGPTQNFASVPAVGQLVLSACMILGRLEFFAFLAILLPECWKR